MDISNEEINKAREAGKAASNTEERAFKAWYNPDEGKVFIELNTGITVGFPYQRLQGLENATPEQLAEVKPSPTGFGVYWETLDVYLAVPHLIAGVFGTKAWTFYKFHYIN